MIGNTEGKEAGVSGGRTNLRRPIFFLVSVLAVVALGASVWFGYGWAQVVFSDKSTAETRDDALAGAEQAAINLNTVDAADIDGSFDTMKSSITGDLLLNDLEQTRSGITEQVRDSGAKSTAELMHSSVTELSESDGTATALVVVAVTTTRPDFSERTKVTMKLAMQLVDDVWKANRVDPVGARISLDNPSASPSIPDPGAPVTDPVAPGASESTGTPEAPAEDPSGTGP